MIYTLENSLVSIKIKQLGAELSSYFDKEANREIMWQADPKHWKRHAPILFPIVGKVENNTYRLNESEYQLSQHGFARDQEFRLIDKTEKEITLEINESPATLAVYPFQFKLQVIFSLKGKELKVSYKVENISNEEIYFCLGAHPGFNCPFDKNTTFDDYQLEFEKNESSDRLLLIPSGFRSGDRSPNWLNGNQIKLKEELFNEDALIFDDLKSSYLNIKSTKSNNKLKVGWINYPHIGIWKPLNNAPFICIEPWNGMADEAGLNNDFKEKFGVVKLNSNNSFECAYTVENKVA